MTDNQMQALLAACEADPELTAAIKSAQTVEALIAVAAEHGFTIVPEDLVALSGESDLSDRDLEQASGGTAEITNQTFFCGTAIPLCTLRCW